MNVEKIPNDPALKLSPLNVFRAAVAIFYEDVRFQLERIIYPADENRVRHDAPYALVFQDTKTNDRHVIAYPCTNDKTDTRACLQLAVIH